MDTSKANPSTKQGPLSCLKPQRPPERLSERFKRRSKAAWQAFKPRSLALAIVIEVAKPSPELEILDWLEELGYLPNLSNLPIRKIWMILKILWLAAKHVVAAINSSK